MECALSIWADDCEDMLAAAQGCCLIQDGATSLEGVGLWEFISPPRSSAAEEMMLWRLLLEPSTPPPALVL